jgi:hypothetical protein
MYGKVNEVCADLLREFSPQDNIALLIWTPQAVAEFIEDLDPTETEVLHILQEIGETDEDAHQRYGIGETFVRETLAMYREEQQNQKAITVPVEILTALIPYIDAGMAHAAEKNNNVPLDGDYLRLERLNALLAME